ncbi:DUF2442 domain-containing protein [Burkholderia multivorans]|uniref:DUF2442 domain-containing protein n=1 Tax=Burkholderia multivorans TaxID=87883 RepID=UPI001C231F56|nr:DUF2442 domain-containing protein [Burkholderia multivorans]MBU9205472.1 DUF2442 domain-containing protein [Burkholderia multivorans]MCO8353482.1 hypothetical protein [Burkholderia multivorans]MCO8385741.1 hypothetical protein [Burkholderia multivorans]MCO8406578.1 hypothetical protein [Burkholderia multivorans]MCO8434837.1 hypothetical protein [Burkholderia multivorans]
MAARKISQDDYAQALARGRQALAEPHVVSARYVASARMLEFTYSNGLTLRIDPKEVPALKDLPRSTLAQAYVTPGGDGLVFGESEVAAVSIPGLIARLIPVDIARRAVAAARGSVRTASKAEAARRNGAKGGRPVKAKAGLVAAV